MFEEDVRELLRMLRPNRRERLLGWKEYRTGGAGFRATISWDGQFRDRPGDRTGARADVGGSGDTHPEGGGTSPVRMKVPRLAEVLESILVGSVQHDDDLEPHEEFEIYRQVVRDLYRRLFDLQECYE